MKILYYDCFAGISGDMNLGALVDLGVSFEYLKDELEKLGLSSEYRLEVKPDEKMGITGTKVDVIDLNEQHPHGGGHNHHHHEGDHDHHHHHEGDHDHHHHHDGDHDHHHHHEGDHDHHHHHEGDHDHQHHHEGDHDHHHHHDGDHDHHHHHEGDHDHSHDHLRTYADIKAIIIDSSLSDAVKKDSIGIFELIAIAEGKVHGKPADEVHFHEVGAIDSIIDVVGAAIAFNALEVDAVWSSPVETGNGFVRCAHGLMPVPAPATAEILTEFPMCSKVDGYEMTTPTGAAILKYYVQKTTTNKAFKILKTAYGMGTRNIHIPNVLRVFLAEAEDQDITQWIIETNIDDMSSEQLVFAEEVLLEKGALDVYKTPIIMKKGRPAIKLSVLVTEAKRDLIEGVIFTHTTSIGLRKYPVYKHKLKRTYEKVTTPYGDITIKRAFYKGECINWKAEYEDCKKAAQAHGVTIETVKNSIKL